jgi:hypothetical protein
MPTHPPQETPLHRPSVPVRSPVSSSLPEHQHHSEMKNKAARILLDSTTPSSRNFNHQGQERPGGVARLFPPLEEGSKIPVRLNENHTMLGKAAPVCDTSSMCTPTRRNSTRSFSTVTSWIPTETGLDIPLMSPTVLAPCLVEGNNFSHYSQGEEYPASLPTRIDDRSATNQGMTRSQLIQGSTSRRCNATESPYIGHSDGCVKDEANNTGTIAITSSSAMSNAFRTPLVVNDTDVECRIEDAVNDEITRAEEERQMIKKLDSIIGRLEEMELLNRILKRIHDDFTDLECAESSPPSRVINVAQVGFENYRSAGSLSWTVRPKQVHRQRLEDVSVTSKASEKDQTAVSFSEMLQPPTTVLEDKTWLTHESHQRRESFLPACEPTPGATTMPTTWEAPSTPSNLENVRFVEEEILFKLPKWAPSRNDGKDILFTMDEFQSKVLDDIFEEDNIHRSLSKKACISEHDQNYVVEARGGPSAIQALREKTELFVRKHVSVANLRLLLEDKDSFLVDVNVVLRRSHSTLGLRFYDFEYEPFPGGGVWVKSMLFSGEVATALGGVQASFNGCSLMAINGKPIYGPRDVHAFVQNVMCSMVGGEVAILTFCLPKNVDLTRVPDLSWLNCRRRNGERVSYSREIAEEESGYESRQALKSLSENTFSAPSEIAKQRPQTWISLPTKAPTTDEELIRAFNTVMEDVRSVEVTFVMSSDEGFGSDIKHISGPSSGLYIHAAQENGQVRRLLGNTACRHGAVLWKVSGIIIEDSEHLDKVLEGIEGSRMHVTLGKLFGERILFNEDTLRKLIVVLYCF